jgi:hypothetical protein
MKRKRKRIHCLWCNKYFYMLYPETNKHRHCCIDNCYITFLYDGNKFNFYMDFYALNMWDGCLYFEDNDVFWCRDITCLKDNSSIKIDINILFKSPKNIYLKLSRYLALI